MQKYKYITEKGYKLFRGNIGDNKHHITKAKKEIEDLNEQIEEILRFRIEINDF